MDLVIDIGNTQTKIAVFIGQEIVGFQAFVNPSLDDIKSFLQDYQGISNGILSTVTSFPDDLKIWLNQSFKLIYLDENTPVPIENFYATPRTLGKDRLAAAVAGSALFPGQDVLVINTGTCITYDFINSSGQYLGGAISPGMQMRFKSLNTFTGKLPFVIYRETENFIGITTDESILSGVIFGITAEMESMVGHYQEKYPLCKSDP